MKRFVSVMVIALLLLTCFSFTTVSSNIVETTSSGTALYVDDDGTEEYTSIQDAIDNASDGDTVFVYNGTYYENILIETSNISLVGENKESTIIDGGGNGDVVYIAANYVTLKKFTIQNSGDDLSWKDSGLDIRGDNINISSSFIKNNYIGICIVNPGDDVSIFSNEIQNCEYTGITLATYDSEIKMNFISNNGLGLQLFSGEGNIIQKNQIVNNDIGIKFGDYSSNQFISYHIEHNIISDNNCGISSVYPYVTNVAYCQNHINNNNFINNGKNSYRLINDYFENNYWDDWIGFGPYWIRGTPFIQLFPSFALNIHINLDRDPASEPFDIETGWES